MVFATQFGPLQRSPRATHARPWAVLALALLLLAVQGLWAAHEIHHLSEGEDGDCVVCLIGGGTSAGLPVALPALSPTDRLAGAQPLAALPPAVACRPVFRPQAARAPPHCASIRR